VIGQIEGGIAQGIGLGLLEAYVPQRTNNLHDYLIPTLGDVAVIESFLIESNDPGGPYGAKGVGEHTIIGTAPAILNAIRDAVGARITSVPATPERVLRAMEEKR
jgi:CO/xanthine dehydrogenase Mo-binding subunit